MSIFGHYVRRNRHNLNGHLVNKNKANNQEVQQS